MSNQSKLIKNTIIIAIGKFSTQIVSFLLLPLYTTYLSTEQYGIYDFIVTIAIFLTPIIGLTLEESMFRFLIDAKDNVEKKSIISQTFLYTIVSCIVFSIIGVIILFFCDFEGKILVIPYFIIHILNGIFNALMRGMGEIRLFSITNFLSSVIAIVLNIIFVVYLKIGISGLLLSIIISNIIVLVYIYIRLQLYRYISIKHIDMRLMKEMIKYSIPLIPNNISWNIINLSDRLIITSVLGSSANGVYAVSNKFPTIINTVYNYFSIAWKENASVVIKEKNSEQYFSYIYVNIRKILFSATIVLIIMMPFVFNLLVNQNYYEAYYYIPILIFSIYFSNLASFLGGIFIAYKDTKTIGATTIFSAVVNIVINIALIKFIGLYAAAISSLVSTFSLYCYRIIKVNKYANLEKNKNMLLYTVIIIFSCIAYYSSNVLLQIIVAIIVTFILIYHCREILWSILKTVHRKIAKKESKI